MAETERRRRRVRHVSSGPDTARPSTAGAGDEPDDGHASAETLPVHDPAPEPHDTGLQPPADEREVERGLRGLVGSGSSQVSTTAAMRARDAARPSDAELAAAARDLVIIRRGWVPRDDLPRPGPPPPPPPPPPR